MTLTTLKESLNEFSLIIDLVHRLIDPHDGPLCDWFRIQPPEGRFFFSAMQFSAVVLSDISS